MQRYELQIINEVRRLRKLGNTYGEIRAYINLQIPKSTLSDWCRDVILPQEYKQRLETIIVEKSAKGRSFALEINRVKRVRYLENLSQDNNPISELIHNKHTAKIALAMLCLGEASKSSRSGSFYLGNSNPKIIQLFLLLLKKCFAYDEKKVRCTIQCRADQNITELEDFWLKITNIPKQQFYRTRIDIRTKGKPTLNKAYKGVLRVDYLDNNVRLVLESLSDLVYNQLLCKGP